MFVIYHVKSTIQVGPMPNGYPHSAYRKFYKTRGAALRTMARFNELTCPDLVGPGPYGVASEEHYRSRVVCKVTRKNLMTGQDYQEDSNTPNFCSPSSETYWSS